MDITTIVIFVPTVVSLVSGIIAFFQGRKKSKITKQMTIAEQREDLRNQMISEIKTAEKQSSLFGATMSKNDIAKWKLETVIKNLKLYALGNQYTWFCEPEWIDAIQQFVADTKEVNYKK